MPNKLFKKGLVVGIIVLLVGVSVLSSVSSKDVSVSNDLILKDNSEIEPLDDCEEIITRIYAEVWFDYIKTSGDGLIYSIELWEGGAREVYIKINGFKKPIYPFSQSYFNEKPTHVIAPRFTGLILPGGTVYYIVIGVAFGNIEWE